MDFFIVIILFLLFFLSYFIGRLIESRIWQRRLKEIRKESVEKSRQVLGGKFVENLSPYFPDFKYDPTEIRFIGTPVDYIVFRGLNKKDPEEIVFLEIKSGNSNLSETQRKLKRLIIDRKVSWDEYRVPRDVTK